MINYNHKSMKYYSNKQRVKHFGKIKKNNMKKIKKTENPKN